MITPDASHLFRILEGKKHQIQIKRLGTALPVQWFQLGVGLILVLGAKIPHASGPKPKHMKNRNNKVINSIMTLQWSTSKKSFKSMRD